MSSRFVEDKRLWEQHMFYMPSASPGGDTLEEAETMPGNCVKSAERDDEHGFPKHHGRLFKYGETCVVLGHNSPVSGPFVWNGTKDEYHRVWDIN